MSEKRRPGRPKSKVVKKNIGYRAADDVLKCLDHLSNSGEFTISKHKIIDRFVRKSLIDMGYKISERCED